MLSNSNETPEAYNAETLHGEKHSRNHKAGAILFHCLENQFWSQLSSLRFCLFCMPHGKCQKDCVGALYSNRILNSPAFVAYKTAESTLLNNLFPRQREVPLNRVFVCHLIKFKSPFETFGDK